MPEKISAEQKARDMLERCGVEDAQSFSAGDVVELANLIAGVPAPTAECHVAWCDNATPHDHHGYPECEGKPCAPKYKAVIRESNDNDVLNAFAALPLPVRMRAARDVVDEYIELGPVEHVFVVVAEMLGQRAYQLEAKAAAEAEKERLLYDIRYVLGYHGTDIPSAALMLLERFDITPKVKP